MAIAAKRDLVAPKWSSAAAGQGDVCQYVNSSDIAIPFHRAVTNGDIDVFKLMDVHFDIVKAASLSLEAHESTSRDLPTCHSRYRKWADLLFPRSWV